MSQESQRLYYRKQREKVIAYLGGECVKCGSTENLEIDHIDRTTKNLGFANMNLSNPKILAELAKCQLLCKPHHLEKSRREAKDWHQPFIHGTIWSIKTCRCEICEAFKIEYNARRRAERAAQPKAKGSYNMDPPVHGERKMYKKGCRCDLCKAGNAQQQRERRARLAQRQRQST